MADATQEGEERLILIKITDGSARYGEVIVDKDADPDESEDSDPERAEKSRWLPTPREIMSGKEYDPEEASMGSKRIKKALVYWILLISIFSLNLSVRQVCLALE